MSRRRMTALFCVASIALLFFGCGAGPFTQPGEPGTVTYRIGGTTSGDVTITYVNGDGSTGTDSWVGAGPPAVSWTREFQTSYAGGVSYQATVVVSLAPLATGTADSLTPQIDGTYDMTDAAPAPSGFTTIVGLDENDFLYKADGSRTVVDQVSSNTVVKIGSPVVAGGEAYEIYDRQSVGIQIVLTDEGGGITTAGGSETSGSVDVTVTP
jgi:hypothetical protein